MVREIKIKGEDLGTDINNADEVFTMIDRIRSIVEEDGRTTIRDIREIRDAAFNVESLNEVVNIADEILDETRLLRDNDDLLAYINDMYNITNDVLDYLESRYDESDGSNALAVPELSAFGEDEGEKGQLPYELEEAIGDAEFYGQNEELVESYYQEKQKLDALIEESRDGSVSDEDIEEQEQYVEEIISELDEAYSNWGDAVDGESKKADLRKTKGESKNKLAIRDKKVIRKYELKRRTK